MDRLWRSSSPHCRAWSSASWPVSCWLAVDLPASAVSSGAFSSPRVRLVSTSCRPWCTCSRSCRSAGRPETRCHRSRSMTPTSGITRPVVGGESVSLRVCKEASRREVSLRERLPIEMKIRANHQLTHLLSVALQWIALRFVLVDRVIARTVLAQMVIVVGFRQAVALDHCVELGTHDEVLVKSGDELPVNSWWTLVLNGS